MASTRELKSTTVFRLVHLFDWICSFVPDTQLLVLKRVNRTTKGMVEDVPKLIGRWYRGVMQCYIEQEWLHNRAELLEIFEKRREFTVAFSVCNECHGMDEWYDEHMPLFKSKFDGTVKCGACRYRCQQREQCTSWKLGEVAAFCKMRHIEYETRKAVLPSTEERKACASQRTFNPDAHNANVAEKFVFTPDPTMTTNEAAQFFKDFDAHFQRKKTDEHIDDSAE